jgi:hypothetical protein
MFLKFHALMKEGIDVIMHMSNQHEVQIHFLKYIISHKQQEKI